MTEHSNTMPPEIATAICSIMKKALTANRGEKDTNGDGRPYSWASVDDIFEAVNGEMAEAGLISEMIVTAPPEWISMFDYAQGCERPALSIMFRFQITNKDGIRYADPGNLWPVIAWFEGMTTTAAARSLAHKQALRDLFKIKTVADATLETPDSTNQQPTASATTQSRGNSKKPVNPLALGPEDSAAKADEIITKLRKAAGKKTGDERANAVRDAFRANAGGIGRLTPEDSDRVMKENASLIEKAD